MKKRIKIFVDCANCAAKMEDAASKVEGVEDVSVSFMTQKMALSAPDDIFDDVLQNVISACKKVEDDCEFYL